MRQLRIQEPWAHLNQGSGDEAVQELLLRVQVLERRLREIEDRIGTESKIEDREPISI